MLQYRLIKKKSVVIMKKELLLSICIPTNGVAEWVLPVIDSIYIDTNDLRKFEVIITDNGTSKDLINALKPYLLRYNNLIYKKTNSQMFLNQIESFKLAQGELIKFVNHRMPLKQRTIEYLIAFVEEYRSIKPGVYFSNGKLKLKPKRKVYPTFNDYVRGLSYWSSWSAGTAIWKSDFQKIDLKQDFNALFPHTDIIFSNRNNSYVIDDEILLDEIPTSSTKKGGYDLFHAFAVEYPHIIEKLYIDGDISRDTFKYVIDKNGTFVSDLYSEFVIHKVPCSYDLNGFGNSMGRYYHKNEIALKVLLKEIRKIIKRLIRTNN